MRQYKQNIYGTRWNTQYNHPRDNSWRSIQFQLISLGQQVLQISPWITWCLCCPPWHIDISCGRKHCKPSDDTRSQHHNAKCVAGVEQNSADNTLVWWTCLPTTIGSNWFYQQLLATRNVNEARSIWDWGRGHKVEAEAETKAKCYDAEAKLD